jgi:hypothetical protein
MIVNTYVPAMAVVSPYLINIAKTGLTLTLFLIGAGLSGKILAAVGIKPLMQGIVLWVIIAGAALYAVMHFA